jgi:CheY-like chemotaxis protein
VEVRSVANAILVADDDPDILSIVSMSLETQGYTVHKATNGREAVDLARQHHPDLILMDMMMPVVSGYEAVGELKADAGTRDIVIVGLSAKAMATDMERATDAGIDGYITKPFRIAQVLSVVESYLAT